jgi:hypothetical protein
VRPALNKVVLASQSSVRQYTPVPKSVHRKDNTASPKPSAWPIDSLAKPASDLKCRCYQFQVVGRRLTLGGSRQDHLDAPTSVPPLIRVEQRGIIRLNVLQGTGQRVWLLGGRMHCDGTKTDNSRSNQHCRDQACSDFCLELVHKLRRVQAM